MRKLVAAAVIVLVAGTSACKKTGEGEYEVQTPTVGVQPETVQAPTIGTTEDTVVVPRVDIRRDTQVIKRPTVER